MKIAVDPGHGMSNSAPGVYDPGAVSTVGGTVFREADIVLRYGLLLRDLLRARGHQVFMTRDDATDPAPVTERASGAEAAACDVFVSLHMNSFESSTANGVEVCYRDDADQLLARKLRDAVLTATGLTRREIKKRTDLAVLRFDGPAALIELGFISNDRDRSTLLKPAVREQVCEAIADALVGAGAGLAMAPAVAVADAGVALAAAAVPRTGASAEYSLPAYARAALGANAATVWSRAKPIAGLGFYSGLVRGSMHTLPAAAGLPNGAVYYEAKFAIDGDGIGGNDEGDDAFQPHTSLREADGRSFRLLGVGVDVLAPAKEADPPDLFGGG